jgi:hypothetical protein
MTLYASGGYNLATSTRPEAIFANLPLLVFLAAGFLMGLLGYIAAPIWLVWLGRVLAQTGDREATVQATASVQN